ncbi:MAG: hypothetical protein ACR2L3_05880 [Actinomycetota bacterium]
MTQYIGRNSTEKKVARNNIATTNVRQKPYAGRWNTPNVDPNPPAVPLAAGFAQPSDTTFEKFAYRLHMDGSPEFKGHVEIAGATSPAVIVTLPAASYGGDAQPSYRIGLKQYFLTVVISADGVTIIRALALYNPTTGTVTLTWHAP